LYIAGATSKGNDGKLNLSSGISIVTDFENWGEGIYSPDVDLGIGMSAKNMSLTDGIAAAYGLLVSLRKFEEMFYKTPPTIY